MASESTRLEALRCADHDRELVAQVLNNAYTEGRITFEEHADRIAKAYDARTFGDLNVLTTDLVPRTRPAASGPAPLIAPAVATVPGYLPAVSDFTGGNAFMSSFKPGAVGIIAPEVTLNAWLGDVRIDLVGATFASRVTTVNVGGLMCELRIRVPEGVDVNLSGVNAIMSDAKVDGLRPRPDGMVLNLQGTVVMGDVKVLGPGVANQRKYEKFVR
ncbi:MAG: DUF1707 and DUF2154 domain-containing protein [Tessaracoccus sp.]|uniref:DUF1707 SHOCT-like domain-containing protein n=1 Tax=Tessaracoccus sp. TaxID=1971211 RepID=UPI001EB9E64A|nr:DUF1707 domain-containing protein [Tessaracoccus sp.]MBK7822482.1 DUF1707 and DUF2154 domain-containing protein [Tessaracoccus sp.]